MAARALLVAFLFLAVFLLYFPTSRLLVDAWNNQSGYSHGWLVLALSVWLVVRQSTSPQGVERRADPWLLMLAGISGIAWLFGYVSSVQALQVVALLGVLFTVFSVFLGRDSLFSYAFPIGILVFSLPLWDLFTPALQHLTIVVNSLVLSSLGWTAYLVEDVVHVSAGSFQIEEGCSGTHYFVIGLTIGAMYSYLNLSHWKTRIAFFISAGIVAMFANWIRVLTIVMVGDLTDMQHYLVSVDHYYFGWFLFVLSLVPLFYLGSWLQRSELEQRKVEVCEAPVAEQTSLDVSFIALLTTMSAFLIFPPVFGTYLTSTANNASYADLVMPDELLDMTLVKQQQASDFDFPIFHGAQFETLATYGNPDRKILIYANRYSGQRQGSELVGYRNRWVPEGWVVSTSSNNNSTIEMGYGRGVLEFFSSRGENWVLVRSYVVGETLIASDIQAKFRSVFRAISSKPAAGALAVYARCYSDCEAEIILASRLMDLIAPSMIKAMSAGSTR